jgi:hypothetical protein
VLRRHLRLSSLHHHHDDEIDDPVWQQPLLLKNKEQQHTASSLLAPWPPRLPSRAALAAVADSGTSLTAAWTEAFVARFGL